MRGFWYLLVLAAAVLSFCTSVFAEEIRVTTDQPGLFPAHYMIETEEMRAGQQAALYVTHALRVRHALLKVQVEETVRLLNRGHGFDAGRVTLPDLIGAGISDAINHQLEEQNRLLANQLDNQLLDLAMVEHPWWERIAEPVLGDHTLNWARTRFEIGMELHEIEAAFEVSDLDGALSTADEFRLITYFGRTVAVGQMSSGDFTAYASRFERYLVSQDSFGPTQREELQQARKLAGLR